MKLQPIWHSNKMRKTYCMNCKFKYDKDGKTLYVMGGHISLVIDIVFTTWQQMKWDKADKRTIQNNLLQRVTIIGC